MGRKHAGSCVVDSDNDLRRNQIKKEKVIDGAEGVAVLKVRPNF
jgi:hypothetical protein